MKSFGKFHALALATTMGIAFILCAVYDALFPPYGLLTALKPAIPFAISGSPIGFITGFVAFTVAGLVLGALYGTAWEFWNRQLR